MKKILSLAVSMACLAAFAQPKLPAVSPNLTQKFQFDANGQFRVMQITDPQGAFPLHDNVKKLLRQGIQKYRPNIIILTGDNTSSRNGHGEFEKVAAEFMNIFVEEKVPHAITFGNHDSERKGEEFYTRQEQYDLYKKTPNCRASVAAPFRCMLATSLSSI